MSEEYNKSVSKHYAAYRPPIHSMILRRVLPETDSFPEGLDIGCGTGYSTRALAAFCSHVYGIDPSHSMLEKAERLKKITYKKGSGENIPVADKSVHIVTLAGSLFYMNLKQVALEIQRVCSKNAVIIVYDFKILLDDILASLSILEKDNDLEYDHSFNFSGVDGFDEIVVRQDQINLEFLGDQLAHVLISEYHLYKKFAKKYSTEHPFEKVKGALVKAGNHFFIKAKIFYSVYRISDSMKHRLNHKFYFKQKDGYHEPKVKNHCVNNRNSIGFERTCQYPR